ncbi:site-specific integrase [Geodermatophilus sp. URMC 61]|uniref:site-specific integrase n=1 Tax=Geodermatophilus sp. URMC 61 TaxID=3423411 RepID=UPI00406D00C0
MGGARQSAGARGAAHRPDVRAADGAVAAATGPAAERAAPAAVLATDRTIAAFGEALAIPHRGQTRAQAERRLREALRDRGTGATPPVPADSRLRTIAVRWLADIDGSDRASGTKRLYRFALHAYVLPGLGELRLREVTVPALDPLLTSVHGAHGPAAAKTTRSALSGILGLAVRHRLLATNPVRETPARRGPRGSRRRPRALTLEEAHQLRARLTADPTAVRQDLPDLVAFLLGTGLRIGEACAVRPTDLDLDLEEGTLTVAGTVTRDPLLGLLIQQRPKTDAGRRTIALPPQTLDLLRRRLARLPAAADPPVLFPSPKGLLRDPNNTSGDLRQALACRPAQLRVGSCGGCGKVEVKATLVRWRRSPRAQAGGRRGE